jgi:hypothetical protein
VREALVRAATGPRGRVARAARSRVDCSSPRCRPARLERARLLRLRPRRGRPPRRRGASPRGAPTRSPPRGRAGDPRLVAEQRLDGHVAAGRARRRPRSRAPPRVERLEHERLDRLEPCQRGRLLPGGEHEHGSDSAARDRERGPRTRGARSASSSTNSAGARAARARAAIAASAASAEPVPAT